MQRIVTTRSKIPDVGQYKPRIYPKSPKRPTADFAQIVRVSSRDGAFDSEEKNVSPDDQSSHPGVRSL